MGCVALRGLACAVGCALERVDADAAQGVNKGLAARALAAAVDAVGVEHGFDYVGHFSRRERGADHLAGDRRAAQATAVRTAKRDLIPLLAVLVHAQDADVAAVVVAAGIDATADVQVDLAQIVQFVHG